MTGAIGDAVWHPTACGCARCLGRTRLEAEAEHGEQGPDALELEVDRLRARVRDLEARLGAAEVMLESSKALHKATLDVLLPSAGGDAAW